jgi:hypothetical protein
MARVPLAAFISHNLADKDAAREIALFLTAEGINVWFDEWEIRAGDSIVEQINAGLQGCTHFLILWSRDSAKSDWVRRELQSALATAIRSTTPRIIPIVLDDTPLPPLIADIKYMQYKGGTESDRGEIVSALTGSGPSSAFVKAVVEKYNELVYNLDAPGPFPFAACPSCGSGRLKGSSTNFRDDVWFIIKCEECGWSDVSQ